MRVAGLLLAGALLAVPAGAGSEPDPRLLDRSGDEVLQQAFIPSARNVHGEFRMLRRGAATCAQTLLYTPSLRRALQRIKKKEMRYWPEGRPGYDDSAAYLAALDEAKQKILGSEPGQEPAGRLQTMAIEFVAGNGSALFAIYELDAVASDGKVTVGALRPIVVRAASPDYVREAMEHMQASAFGPASGEDEP